jgi:hypothetical protein
MHYFLFVLQEGKLQTGFRFYVPLPSSEYENAYGQMKAHIGKPLHFCNDARRPQFHCPDWLALVYAVSFYSPLEVARVTKVREKLLVTCLICQQGRAHKGAECAHCGRKWHQDKKCSDDSREHTRQCASTCVACRQHVDLKARATCSICSQVLHREDCAHHERECFLRGVAMLPASDLPALHIDLAETNGDVLPMPTVHEENKSSETIKRPMNAGLSESDSADLTVERLAESLQGLTTGAAMPASAAAKEDRSTGRRGRRGRARKRGTAAGTSTSSDEA